ncbi:NepR family anti-sigma factor [Henriciella sp. AS95]|uniref:NepR family anti-sigma factor n=1 Tax=Henriciella sp. AS95 TaxID=3135782 RepID=UPI00316D36C9
MSKDKSPRSGRSEKTGRKPSSWLKEKPVGEALRSTFRDVLNEPVPDKLQDLINKLREEERKKNK